MAVGGVVGSCGLAVWGGGEADCGGGLWRRWECQFQTFPLKLSRAERSTTIPNALAIPTKQVYKPNCKRCHPMDRNLSKNVRKVFQVENCPNP